MSIKYDYFAIFGNIVIRCGIVKSYSNDIEIVTKDGSTLIVSSKDVFYSEIDARRTLKARLFIAVTFNNKKIMECEK